jgi:hypothetical protein
MDCKLRPGAELPAIVADARSLVPEGNAVWVREDGIQTALVRIPSPAGEFSCIAQTSGRHGPRLQPGHLVCWKAFKHQREMGRAIGDDRSGWIGLIIGTLAPELNAEGWKGLERFHD